MPLRDYHIGSACKRYKIDTRGTNGCLQAGCGGVACQWLFEDAGDLINGCPGGIDVIYYDESRWEVER